MSKMKSKFYLERLGISYSIRLNEGQNIVGRAAQSTVKISGCFGSRYHCNIIIDNDKVSIQDLSSSNGTYINENEYKGETVEIKVNDKIGIGVHSVDSVLEQEQYHVYILRKIILENNDCNNCENKDESESSCIEISDSDNDVEEILRPVNKEINRRPGPKSKTELNNKNVAKKAKQSREDEKQISVASTSKSKPNSNLARKISQQSDQDEKQKSVEVAISSNIKHKDKSNQLRRNSKQSDQDKKQTSVTITSNTVNIAKDHKNDQKKVNEIIKISNEESNSGSNIENDLQNKKSDFEKDDVNNEYDFQSDEFSQAVWDEIKQEIADLDFSELQSNDDDLNNLKNDLPVKDFLDLTLDDDALKNEEDDDDFDVTTRQWFMKLSQNFDDSLEKKSKKSYVNELNTKADNESVIDKEKETKLKSVTEDDRSSLDRKENETRSVIDDTVGTCSTKNVEDSLKKIDLTKQSKRSNILIDALSLPSRKGKRKCESREPSKERIKISPVKTNKNKTPTKDIRALYATNCTNNLKLQKKWLEKPNAIREKARAKQIKDKRKEKLKQLADKNDSKEKYQEVKTTNKTPEKRKLSISVDELDDDERNKLIKKAKVKITNKNRGAFLTELSKEPSKKITNQVNSGETSTRDKDEFSKAITSVDCTLNKFDTQKIRRKSFEKPTVKLNEKTSNSFELVNKSCPDKEQNFKIPKLPLKGNKNSVLKSCLKSLDNILSKKKTKKSVKFNSKPMIHTYEIELEVEQNIEQNKISDKNMMQPALSDFESRKRIWKLKSSQNTGIILDDILTDILSWKPAWLSDEKANVNISNIVYPMLHSFKTFADYKRIVFPLMKLELWERLIKDKRNSPNKYIDLNLKKIEIEDKTSEKRIIYTCEYTNSCPLNKPLFYISELVLIKILNKESIFGHVRNSRCFNPTSNTAKVYSIQLESNLHTNLLLELKHIKIIQIQKVSIISTELGAFEAVKNLGFSPLLKKILNPSVLIQNDDVITDNNLKKYKYNGYDKMNEVQQRILMHSYLLSINPLKDNITLIEGPPGTGKSRLITNLILQLQYGLELKQLDRKILVCAQSNTAVDVIALKLIRIRQKMDKKKFRLVRYGVLEKMHPEVKPYSLCELIKLQKRSSMKNPEMISLMEEKELLEKKIINLENKRRSNTRDDHDLDKAKTDLNRIKNSLSQQFNDIDRNLEYKFLANATIICTTLSSCVRLLRYCNFFDVCIIDEATQCSEPWTLIPLQFGINSLVLIGDTQQLPATTLSNLSRKYNYGKSLFTRAKEVLENSNQSIIMSLKIQYRMHPEICKWPNSYFYKNCLLNGETTNFTPSVKPYSIIELNFNQNKIATNGIENCSEANFIVKLVQGLVKIMPPNTHHYGIITPYSLHCQKLREKLRKEKLEIEVNTIDSYQGKERDIIIISNARTEGVGFLNEICRLNVALTRARKCLILCGNFQQLSNINVWKSLLSDAKRRNIYFEPKESEILDFQNKIIGKLKL